MKTTRPSPAPIASIVYNDFLNRPDDPQYMVRLIARVITLSLETVKIVKALPPLSVAAA